MKIENAKNIFGGTILTGVFCFFIYSVCDNKKEDAEMAENAKYTIGVITKKYRFGEKVRYDYSVDSINYFHVVNVEKGAMLKQGYLVEFLAKDPEKANILFQFFIPDTLKKAPLSGWLKLPIELHSLSEFC